MSSGAIVQLEGVSHVSFEGITVAYSRGSGIQIHDSSFVVLLNTTVMNVGVTAISVDGGTNNAVLGCTVRNAGGSGIYAHGGDRPSLSPANHSIEDCVIHDFGRRCLTYNPGVSLSGVGVSLLRSELYNAPHSAVLISGNNMLVESNVIHHTVQQESHLTCFL